MAKKKSKTQKYKKNLKRKLQKEETKKILERTQSINLNKEETQKVKTTTNIKANNEKVPIKKQSSNKAQPKKNTIKKTETSKKVGTKKKETPVGLPNKKKEVTKTSKEETKKKVNKNVELPNKKELKKDSSNKKTIKEFIIHWAKVAKSGFTKVGIRIGKKAKNIFPFIKKVGISIVKGTKIVCSSIKNLGIYIGKKINTIFIQTKKAILKLINYIKTKIKNRKPKTQKTQSPEVKKQNQLVDKDKVNYNILYQQESKKEKKESLKVKISLLLTKIKQTKKTKTTKIKLNKKVKEPIVIKEIPVKKEIPEKIKKNVFLRFFYEIFHNLHIVFNTLLIVTFIILLIGLIRIDTFSKGTIIYISCIALFLMTVAISYNKYLSGKVFTLILTAAMGFAIYSMQYTYDFIRNLNSSEYEYKTYYVVTFDNDRNKSIYNINNKKVGLLKENSINIERKLNTKLDEVNYIEYTDINQLFSDFFSQKSRAILLNENQYKYLKNGIEKNNRDVKILYEFKVNAKK